MDMIQFKLVMVMFQVLSTRIRSFTKSNIQPLKYLKEFRVDENNEFKIGQVLKC
jgi:hypothetical protein